MTLLECQNINRQIYQIANDRIYTSQELGGKIGRYVTKVVKSVRKEAKAEIPSNLLIAFSWAMALANRLHISLHDEVWKRFPYKCPYCTTCPCGCKERAEHRSVILADRSQRPVSLDEYIRMFLTIYPNNTTKDSILHLCEESLELTEALMAFSRTQGKEGRWFGEVGLELTDVIANTFAVCACEKIDLESLYFNAFNGGCPSCKKRECDCGFTIADSIGSRSIG
jgi:hypothetical protein